MTKHCRFNWDLETAVNIFREVTTEKCDFFLFLLGIKKRKEEAKYFKNKQIKNTPQLNLIMASEAVTM